MHGGTNKQVTELFSQNMNTICIFRLKTPLPFYNGKQYTGTLYNIFNSLHNFDVSLNASIILNNTEYEEKGEFKNKTFVNTNNDNNNKIIYSPQNGGLIFFNHEQATKR